MRRWSPGSRLLGVGRANGSSIFNNCWDIHAQHNMHLLSVRTVGDRRGDADVAAAQRCCKQHAGAKVEGLRHHEGRREKVVQQCV